MFGNASDRLVRQEQIRQQHPARDAGHALDFRAPLGRYPSGSPVAYNRLVKAQKGGELAHTPGPLDGYV